MGTTENAVYTCPDDVTAMVSGRFMNATTSDVQLTLKAKAADDATSRYVEPPGAPIAGKQGYMLRGLVLEAGDEFRPSSDIDAIDYWLNIVETAAE